MIEQLFERLFKRHFRSANYKAIVVSVDKATNTCKVKDVEDDIERKAKLTAIEQVNQTQLVVYPEVGSVVLCGSLFNNPAQAFIIQIEKVDEIIWKGGEQGGILKPATFLTELNKTNDAVNAILQVFSNWNPIPEDGGAALKAQAGSLGDHEVGDFSDVQDSKFKV